MRKTILTLALLCPMIQGMAQHMGIVRKNYFSSYFDTTLNITVQVLDSSTIRLGSINPLSGAVSAAGNTEYNMGINLTGATVNPYQNSYYISSGNNLLTMDGGTGNMISSVTISGSLQSSAFQNYRFNPSDSSIYGLVPQNFYSSYFDSLTMSTVQVLDSSHLRFASINPATGQYTLIGNTPYRNVYTLAGNSIDPHQMVYYYSAVDTLVGIDLYTGNIYSEVPIQVPANTLFENFTYSCADTSIYGLIRQNFVSSVYDSILQQFVDVVDSTHIKLSRIDPSTGSVTVISPSSLALGATLNGSCFIDPVNMIYYFSTGNEIVGVSLLSGLITSSATLSFPSGAMFFDMMRSTQNCFGALRVRTLQATGIPEPQGLSSRQPMLHPNPSHTMVQVSAPGNVLRVELFDITGKRLLQGAGQQLNVQALVPGVYQVLVYTEGGQVYAEKLVKYE